MSIVKTNPAPIRGRKKIRTTIVIVGILVVIFGLMTAGSALMLPSKTVYTDIAGDEITSSALFYGKSGEDYFIASGTTFERHSLSDDKLIQSRNYLADIDSYVEQENVQLLDGSLLQFYFLYANKDSGDNALIVIDNQGNLFKWTDGEQGLVFSSDCMIQSSAVQLIKMVSDGDELYILSNLNNRILLQCYDLNDLSAGACNSRYIWSVDSVGEETSQISPLTYKIKLWDFVVEGDYLYLATDLGLYKVNKHFNDYADIKFLDAADNAYADYLRSTLKAADAEAKQQHGLTDEIIDGMTRAQMAEIFKSVTGIKTTQAKANAAEVFVEENDWCVAYDASTATLTVKNEYLDSDAISTVKGSMYVVLRGVVYSAENKMFYIANNYDDTLWCAALEDVNSVSLTDGKTFGDIAKELDISFGGKKFHESKSLEWNENANTLYVAFANDNKIIIVDINDGKSELKYNFEAGFDIQEFVGDKNNDKMYFLNVNKSTDLTNTVTLRNYVTCIEPRKSENTGVTRTMLIVSAAMTVVSLVVLVYAIRLYKNPAVAKKTAVIGKDLRKNKWTYISLIPFVVLLVMFCYYEAIGSIVLSFFDYTRDKPTMAWNNFANYIKVFNDDDFLRSVGNTLFFLVFDVFIAIVPPFIFAFFLSVMRNKKYSGIVRAALLIPGIIPGVATMLIWRVGIFGETGVLNTLLSAIGKDSVAWLENTSISRWSLLLMSFPFIGQYLVFYGAIMNIPKDYYEAAELDGISVFRRFVSIDLPMCKPQIIYVLITTMINSAQNYARTYMLRSSGTVTLAEKMYKAMTSNGANYGLSSAYAMVIFAMLMVALIMNFKMQKKSFMGES